MIRITTIVICMLICRYAYAQDCGSYPLLKKGNTVEYTEPGKESSRSFTVKEVKSDSSSCRATVHAKIPFFKNTYFEHDFDVVWEDNVFKISIFAFGYGSMMAPDKKKKKKSSEEDDVREDMFLEYPADMEVGHSFNNIVADMNVLVGKTTYKVRMSIINREVVGKETVSTAAGKYECFKITHDLGVKSEQVNTMNQKTHVTEWFAPGVGVVKTAATGSGSFADMSVVLAMSSVKVN